MRITRVGVTGGGRDERGTRAREAGHKQVVNRGEEDEQAEW